MNVLDGIRVVDLTMWAFVPSAGGVLAHWGADVIKIEGPRTPDPMRLLGGTLDAGDASWYFKHYSRGKRSLTLDLKSTEGRDILYRLVESADVFLTSYLPKTRKALKFDIDDIRAVNPSIVYARGTGQGPKGSGGRAGRLRRSHLVVPRHPGREHDEGHRHRLAVRDDRPRRRDVRYDACRRYLPRLC